MSQWRDLDSRPFAYKANALARLSYIGTEYNEISDSLKCSLLIYPVSFYNLGLCRSAMKYIPPHKLKVIMGLFFGTGIAGIFLGLNNNVFYLTFLGVINLCLGGFAGWIFLTQKPRLRDKRKEK